MKTIFATDFHIHHGQRPEVNAFCDMIEDCPPDLTVLGGDIADRWQGTWKDILECPAWKRMQSMANQLYHRGYPIMWIPYNHDYGAKPEYLPGAEMVDRVIIDGWMLCHGWEFSLDWGLGPVDNVAYWMARNKPEWMIPFYHKFFKTPGQLVNYDARTYREKWHWKIETGHSIARMKAQETNLNVAVGHFHTRILEPDFFADAGHNVGSNSWLVIVDGKAALGGTP